MVQNKKISVVRTKAFLTSTRAVFYRSNSNLVSFNPREYTYLLEVFYRRRILEVDSIWLFSRPLQTEFIFTDRTFYGEGLDVEKPPYIAGFFTGVGTRRGKFKYSTKNTWFFKRLRWWFSENNSFPENFEIFNLFIGQLKLRSSRRRRKPRRARRWNFDNWRKSKRHFKKWYRRRHKRLARWLGKSTRKSVFKYFRRVKLYTKKIKRLRFSAKKFTNSKILFQPTFKFSGIFRNSRLNSTWFNRKKTYFLTNSFFTSHFFPVKASVLTNKKIYHNRFWFVALNRSFFSIATQFKKKYSIYNHLFRQDWLKLTNLPMPLSEFFSEEKNHFQFNPFFSFNIPKKILARQYYNWWPVKSSSATPVNKFFFSHRFQKKFIKKKIRSRSFFRKVGGFDAQKLFSTLADEHYQPSIFTALSTSFAATNLLSNTFIPIGEGFSRFLFKNFYLAHLYSVRKFLRQFYFYRFARNRRWTRVVLDNRQPVVIASLSTAASSEWFRLIPHQKKWKYFFKFGLTATDTNFITYRQRLEFFHNSSLKPLLFLPNENYILPFARPFFSADSQWIDEPEFNPTTFFDKKIRRKWFGWSPEKKIYYRNLKVLTRRNRRNEKYLEALFVNKKRGRIFRKILARRAFAAKKARAAAALKLNKVNSNTATKRLKKKKIIRKIYLKKLYRTLKARKIISNLHHQKILTKSGRRFSVSRISKKTPRSKTNRFFRHLHLHTFRSFSVSLGLRSKSESVKSRLFQNSFFRLNFPKFPRSTPRKFISKRKRFFSRISKKTPRSKTNSFSTTLGSLLSKFPRRTLPKFKLFLKHGVRKLPRRKKRRFMFFPFFALDNKKPSKSLAVEKRLPKVTKKSSSTPNFSFQSSKDYSTSLNVSFLSSKKTILVEGRRRRITQNISSRHPGMNLSLVSASNFTIFNSRWWHGSSKYILDAKPDTFRVTSRTKRLFKKKTRKYKDRSHRKRHYNRFFHRWFSTIPRKPFNFQFLHPRTNKVSLKFFKNLLFQNSTSRLSSKFHLASSGTQRGYLLFHFNRNGLPRMFQPTTNTISLKSRLPFWQQRFRLTRLSGELLRRQSSLRRVIHLWQLKGHLLRSKNLFPTNNFYSYLASLHKLDRLYVRQLRVLALFSVNSNYYLSNRLIQLAHLRWQTKLFLANNVNSFQSLSPTNDLFPLDFSPQFTVKNYSIKNLIPTAEVYASKPSSKLFPNKSKSFVDVPNSLFPETKFTNLIKRIKLKRRFYGHRSRNLHRKISSTKLLRIKKYSTYLSLNSLFQNFNRFQTKKVKRLRSTFFALKQSSKNYTKILDKLFWLPANSNRFFRFSFFFASKNFNQFRYFRLLGFIFSRFVRNGSQNRGRKHSLSPFSFANLVCNFTNHTALLHRDDRWSSSNYFFLSHRSSLAFRGVQPGNFASSHLWLDTYSQLLSQTNPLKFVFNDYTSDDFVDLIGKDEDHQ